MNNFTLENNEPIRPFNFKKLDEMVHLEYGYNFDLERHPEKIERFVVIGD